MSRKQMWTAVAAMMFVITWGLDIISDLKLGNGFVTQRFISAFSYSQLVYGVSTIMLTVWVLRKTWQRKHWLVIAIAVLLLIVAFVLLRYLLEEMIYPATIGYRNYNPTLSFGYYFLDNIYYALVYIFMGTGLFFADEMVAAKKRQVALLQANREAELAFLRSQVNPHFLFNSLNNIYSLSYKGSPRTTDAIMKLSELMRYMLYEPKEMVPLVQEWEYVQHFIGLQQLRYDHPLQTGLRLEGKTGEWNIPPYLLIAVTENAFKHGNMAHANTFVLHVKAGANTLHCYSENVVAAQQKDSTGGIGLENIQRRLALVYGDKHSIDIQQDDERFAITLQLTR